MARAHTTTRPTTLLRQLHSSAPAAGSGTMDSLTAVLAAIVGPVVRDAVLDALAELSHNEKNSRVLLNRADLARALGVSIATVARLRAEGVPCLLVGDSPRFCLEAVVPWLEARSLQRQDGAL